jgi:GNAT superfamily N-acetyltransferase
MTVMTDVGVDVSCVIRVAKLADVPAMAGLLAELFAIETEFRVDRAKQERALRMIIERPSAAAWVAEVDGRIVAMVTAQTVVSTAEGGESVWIEDVIVRGEYRRRGIGRRLVQAVEQWCAGRGVTRMQLLADSSNEAACEFYPRRGWTRTGMVAFRKIIAG